MARVAAGLSDAHVARSGQRRLDGDEGPPSVSKDPDTVSSPTVEDLGFGISCTISADASKKLGSLAA